MNSVNPGIRTIIVDDEKPSREALFNYITEFCQILEVVAICKSVKEAYKAILDHNPQLVFLDIEMPRGTGFDLLKMVKIIDFNVVFITAFPDYATKAFRVGATDFLLKPVKVSELIEAVKKVQENLKYRSFQNLTALMENIEAPFGPIKKLVIPNLKGFIAVNPSDIIMCQANGYCTIFHIAGKPKVSSSYHLKYYEEFLPSKLFLRVHNSYIINLAHVSGYTNQGEIILTENLRSPLSKHNKPAFLQYYKNWKQ
jgi:two-component system, LytTR family, response regulator